MSQSEAIPNIPAETAKPRRNLKRVGQAAAAFALEHSPETVRRKGEDLILKRILSSPAFEVRPLVGGDEVRKALQLEQEVWHQENYGDLEDYKKYLPQSRIVAAFDGEDCVAVSRLFAGTPELPPFIAEMPINDPAIKKELIAGCKNHLVEEFGTVAVKKENRNGRIFLDLCRYDYRDATERNIAVWGIIMEPERVRKMNKFLGFTFEQIGPPVDYQGGECAAHIMYFDDVRQTMSATKPELYDWFVNQPLEK